MARRAHRKLVRIGPWLSVLVLVASVAVACAEPKVKRTTPRLATATEIRQLWIEPADITRRDLFWGPGGRALAPENGSTFKLKEEKASGYSPGFTVEDARGREWSAKQGPEAQSEVAASRIYWAAGYHQPPTYFVAEWTLEGGRTEGPQMSARFRPDIGKVIGDWSLHQNPFVGTQPYRGLLVLHVMLNNWDIKPEQNRIYEFEEPRNGARRWFVVRDVGASFGRPRWPDGSRSDPDGYEQHPFIVGFEGTRVKFADQGRHDELLRHLTRRDVRWMAERLAKLSDRQLADAFRAAGYPDPVASRFIRRLKQKIDEGLAACPRGC
ncbi:MAG TPA: hypothetical protein VK886_07435 [Vicinamibacterales bacterium]|nr:hypothetical protein [Vicinamibacterales bacterium]